MPSLTLKNVPEDLHQRLKEQAERHRRSMNQEAIWILEQALSPIRRDAEEVIAKAEVLNQDIDKEFDASLVEKNKRREGLQ